MEPKPSSSVNVSDCGGRSASVAVAVNVISVSSFPDCGGIVSSTGDDFTSLTVTVIVSLSDNAPVPSSVTRIVIGYVPGPWSSVGVQLKSPPEVMEAPVGAEEAKLNVRELDA